MFIQIKARGVKFVIYKWVIVCLHVLGLEILERRRLIQDLILCYKYLHGLIETDSKHFLCLQQFSKTRNDGLKLYKAHSNIDARKIFLLTVFVYQKQLFVAAIYLF